MRRKDREILNREEMLQILKKCDCCRIGLVDENGAYIVPMNFGYEEDGENLYLYFHGATEGKKIELIKKQGLASFEMDRKHEFVKGDIACQYSFLYQSIMGKGKIEILESYEDKIKGLDAIMAHYTDKPKWKYDERVVNRVSIIKMTVTEWSCKEH